MIALIALEIMLSCDEMFWRLLTPPSPPLSKGGEHTESLQGVGICAAF